MNPDSWDNCEYTFLTEEGLKSFVNEKLECLFRVRAVYRLDDDILKR